MALCLGCKHRPWYWASLGNSGNRWEALGGPRCVGSLKTYRDGERTSDLRPFLFTEERKVPASSVSDISSKSNALGADSENCLRNLKVGSQGKGPR